MGDYILNVLQSQTPILWSWGFSSPSVIKDGLRFTVNGRRHKGQVEIIYNGGSDYFDLTFLRNDVIQFKINDVSVGELIGTIDDYVETHSDEQFLSEMTVITDKSSPFYISNVFVRRMIEDFTKGLIPADFAPYFHWKMDRCALKDIPYKTARYMIDKSSDLLESYYDKYPSPYDDESFKKSDDPWQVYHGYGEDKYIVSYLEHIDAEISELIYEGFFQK